MSKLHGVRVRDRETKVESFVNSDVAQNKNFEILEDKPKAKKRTTIPRAISEDKGDDNAGTPKDG